MPIFQIQSNNLDRSFTFSGEIFESEIENLKLDPVDRALLNDPPETAADQLLVLEMLYRRCQEQNPKNSKPVEKTPKETP